MPPVVTLLPNASSTIFPLQFRRSESVYITSYLQLNCAASLSIIIKWTVRNCTPNCSSEVQFGSSVVTTRSELFIPGKILPYGIYELQLTVTMTVFSNLTSSAFTYIKINPSNITVNLVPLGTPMITHGDQQNLTLNPGEYSLDPDTTFNKSVSHC